MFWLSCHASGFPLYRHQQLRRPSHNICLQCQTTILVTFLFGWNLSPVIQLESPPRNLTQSDLSPDLCVRQLVLGQVSVYDLYQPMYIGRCSCLINSAFSLIYHAFSHVSRGNSLGQPAYPKTQLKCQLEGASIPPELTHPSVLALMLTSRSSGLAGSSQGSPTSSAASPRSCMCQWCCG